MGIMWQMTDIQDYEHNKMLAGQFCFAFVGCIICAHKAGHPESDTCKECIAGSVPEGEK